jgi:hypothetical protein
MTARRASNEAGYADVVGIVVLEDVLGPRSVCDRRLQALGGGDHVLTGAAAAGAAVDGGRVACGGDCGGAIKISVAGAYDPRARCNAPRAFRDDVARCSEMMSLGSMPRWRVILCH